MPSNDDPVLGQQMNPLARPQAGTFGVPLIEAGLGKDLLLPRSPYLVIRAAVRDRQEFCLPQQRDDTLLFAFDECQP